MSRRDLILALVKSKPETQPTSLPFTNKRSNIDALMNKKRGPLHSTDINQIWSRQFDFNDFPSVFDYKNEYENSNTIVQSYDLTNFEPYKGIDLQCLEFLHDSDDDESSQTKAPTHIFGDSDDSVRDKNYLPSSSDSDSDMSDCAQRTKNTVAVVDVHSSNRTAAKDQRQRPKAVPSTSQHTDLEDYPSYRPALTEDHDNIEPYVPEPTELIVSEETDLDRIARSPEVTIGKGFTKSGEPRKRRRFEEPLSVRNKKKKEKETEKLSLKPPCGYQCRKKCSTTITEEMRIEIHKRYVNLNWEGRGLFIKGYVDPQNVKTRTVTNKENVKRAITYNYNFDVNNKRVQVCKHFFLSTLGYNPKNDRRVHLALKSAVDEQYDKRGRYERQNIIDKDKIKNHIIETYQPAISHYRREHAPNRLYLPSDINISMMHQQYLEKYPNEPASMETYRKVLRKMNISFANLGHEECEQCALYKQHIDNNECCQNPDLCEICVQYSIHKDRYTVSRQKYQEDVDSATSSSNKDFIYYSVDLQKVIMLPRMEQYKVAIFCPRIIAFNESFVPLGPTKKENVPYAVLWNETISGRNQEDIISTFRSFLIYKRDIKNIVLWADNCAAQNKNWAFICFLINIVNSTLIETDSITIKYFEPGHTFMSADHFHHQVEKSLKKKQKVYDFDDFIDVVRLSNATRNEVKVMAVEDFFNFEDVSSQYKIRNTEPRVYLKDIMAIQVKRGDFQLNYRIRHDGDWFTLSILKAKIEKTHEFPVVKKKNQPRGITTNRKNEIISKLVPLMPETRNFFLA